MPVLALPKCVTVVAERATTLAGKIEPAVTEETGLQLLAVARQKGRDIMGFFSSLFGIGESDHSSTNHTSTSDGVRSVRMSWNDSDKGTSRHETTWSKTDYGTGRHEEGWHGKDYDKSHGQK